MSDVYISCQTYNIYKDTENVSNIFNLFETNFNLYMNQLWKKTAAIVEGHQIIEHHCSCSQNVRLYTFQDSVNFQDKS